nr:MAG TPA: hypothetical protein [Caudoviricetes sp.]
MPSQSGDILEGLTTRTYRLTKVDEVHTCTANIRIWKRHLQTDIGCLV